MANAPQNAADIRRFLQEVPYWTAEKHGAKYRFMYQVYTSPKYRKYGTEFFSGVTKRYTEYAKSLEPKQEGHSMEHRTNAHKLVLWLLAALSALCAALALAVLLPGGARTAHAAENGHTEHGTD